MTIFEAVKSKVTPGMAAERYGRQVSRSGMVRCPFYDDTKAVYLRGAPQTQASALHTGHLAPGHSAAVRSTHDHRPITRVP